MARPPNPEIRVRLRNQAVDYVLTHGVSDLALRPLAKALKQRNHGCWSTTSDRERG